MIVIMYIISRILLNKYVKVMVFHVNKHLFTLPIAASRLFYFMSVFLMNNSLPLSVYVNIGGNIFCNVD